ncbi:MAG: hypothetical protein A3E61_01880 [Candidatus Colwellbacteria bacterium RIFCSPHIGHO2_12_FULL_43_12]|uniref:Uncharacterized protein n=3 Tax=Candidatus Colwelliibacteriota TaxID=1817904 RepID=A0A1G1YZ83_9BACT|nr:MAG: hypothetical protein A3D47_01115 [Candidatus Colwellbacteria bacterium RIFCSPHIGHO2_02_FULL_43_15]OGY58713.1 MAG: hypothetical protein A3E61_01880 [Candidatus Colwellbacteria bacterium RIFCSPHIGHO2_12_FULL_43_12]OGY61263.1 MAG: hypothetical protein A3F99_00545 [Candidatus Colwellbacteria bacterium RIFCSPLOWO2_12_FULL_43_11]
MEKIKKESDEVRHELQEKMVGYIAGALGLVAGLAWNEAIKAFIENLFPLAKDTLAAKFIYAVIITLVVGLTTVYLIKFLGKKEENKQ